MSVTVERNPNESNISEIYVSFRKKKEYENKGKPTRILAKKDDKNYFTLRREKQLGSDPRLQTCRGKLQNRRSKLNMEINKELMLRSGAENLLSATHNKKLKDMVSLELQFFNSNLTLLKDQLGELNSSVDIYQGNSSKIAIPMIPLGLKETNEIQFREPFKDFILEHYSEDPSTYEESITEFMELREAMRTPERDESGIHLLFEYFNQLYFIDRRFFPPDRSLGIYFEWYDSLTGVPSCQRTVAFEKACVLFNLAGLYTQLGARHDRSSPAGLDSAVNCFLKASGVFRFLHDTFTNAPSKDLSPEVLNTFIQLMLAQSRECLHEKAILNHRETVEVLLELAQESERVSKEYEQVYQQISSPTVKDYVPQSWVSLIHIKSEHYKGRAHYFIADALLSLQPLSPLSPDPQNGNERSMKMERKGEIQEVNRSGNGNDVGLSHRAREILMFIHIPTVSTGTIRVILPTNRKERTMLGLSHGMASLSVHEEALRLMRMCRDLRSIKGLSETLCFFHEESLHLLEDYQDEDEFTTVLDPPDIAPSSKIQLSISSPDFSSHRVEDIFKNLGPVALFSARHRWTAPRPANLVRTATQGFGFAVKGDAPVIIAGVDRGSLAERAGVCDGDIIVGISGNDVKWLPHEDVVTLIREAGNCLKLTLVTPCEKNGYKMTKSKSLKDLSPNSTTSSSSSGVSSSVSSGNSSQRSCSSSRGSNYGSLNSCTISSTTSNSKEKRLSWNPFKRAISRDRLKEDNLVEHNVILR